MLNHRSILVTGGTGSFGRQFCTSVLAAYRPERLIIYSRDELKQSEMQADPTFQHPAVRFFLGDVRDLERLSRAMKEVDVVVHAAALKQVPAAEYNPHEFIKTNINGAMNIVEAALTNGVEKVIALSTDKAVNPINLYGATKLCSDKIFTAANSYAGRNPTSFAVVRYGNVLGSRGSVIPVFLKQKPGGIITLTDPRMTRFFITLKEGVAFTLRCLERMSGGELFVPKIPSCTLDDLATAVCPESERRMVGIRPGEKLHETLIPGDEAHLTIEFEDYYIVLPVLPFLADRIDTTGGKRCKAGFHYASNTNTQWLSVEELREVVQQVAAHLGLPY